ncbi:MAG: helix-turn-helix transcriptional regulator [Rhizomicrobium sp.]
MDAQSIHPLRAYRLSQNPSLSQADLADRLGTTKPNLSRIESGKQGFSNRLLAKLVAETGISAERWCPDLAKLFRRRRPKPARGAARKKRAA